MAAVDLSIVRVRDWMAAPLPAITPRTSVSTALKLLREHRAVALPVLDGGRVVGLVDETSLLRFTPSEATTLDVYELRNVLDKMTVGRAAAPVSTTVSPDTPLAAAATAMRFACTQVLPVMDGDRLVGLLPWTRVLAAVVGEPARVERATAAS